MRSWDSCFTTVRFCSLGRGGGVGGRIRPGGGFSLQKRKGVFFSCVLWLFSPREGLPELVVFQERYLEGVVGKIP